MVLAVIGGDARYRVLAERFARAGAETVCSCTAGERGAPPQEAARRADCVILPAPALDGEGKLAGSHGLAPEAVFASLRPGTAVLLGRPDDRLRAMAEQAGAELVDYLAREDYALANADLTAEGAVSHLLRVRDRALSGSRVLVLGYGRIGSVLARRLAGMNARVTVSARRREKRIEASGAGFDVLPGDLPGDGLGAFDAVVNTVPAPVLNAPELARLRRDCYCLDLASRPGGIDLDAAAELGIQGALVPGLPGKTAPESAGELLFDVISDILKERNLL